MLRTCSRGLKEGRVYRGKQMNAARPVLLPTVSNKLSLTTEQAWTCRINGAGVMALHSLRKAQAHGALMQGQGRWGQRWAGDAHRSSRWRALRSVH